MGRARTREGERFLKALGCILRAYFIRGGDLFSSCTSCWLFIRAVAAGDFISTRDDSLFTGVLKAEGFSSGARLLYTRREIPGVRNCGWII